MLTIVRLTRVALTLVLAFITLSLIVGVARPETGPVEKVVLVLLIVGCFVLAERIATWSTQAQAWVRRS